MTYILRQTLIVLLLAPPLAAQVKPPLSLRQLTRPAGYIFAGRVTSVRARLTPDQVGTVEITFRVERSIRGAQPGSALTIREWAGLWSSGARYRVGERVMLFLYPPSPLGLTSPVGGDYGHFALDHDGQVILGPARSHPTFTAPEVDPPLRGRNRVAYRDFARAIRRAAEE